MNIKEKSSQIKPKKCKICNATFKNFKNLLRHIDVLHEGKKAFKCFECGKQFTRQVYLKNHTDMNCKEKSVPTKPKQCKICNATFKNFKNLLRHINVLHEGKKPFECFECGKRFTRQVYLKKHTILVHKIEKPFKCTLCLESFTKTSFKKHMVEIHEDRKPFRCNICNFASIFDSNLKNHYVKAHTESIEDGTKHNCSECIFSIESKTLLLKHIRKVHGGIKSYSCAQCKYRGATKQWLKSHVDSVHTVLDSDHTCSKCGHSFKNR